MIVNKRSLLDSVDGGIDNENVLKKIVGKKIFDDLSSIDKNELLNQIQKLDDLDIINNGIKIRVKPGFINMLRKVLGVHDIKGGAYRGSTLYLGDKEDLFNKDLIVHESIHVKQQAELSKNAFLGFVKWLFYSMESMKKYKKDNSGTKNLNYDATIMIPTELEAYAYSDDPSYIANREGKAFEKYENKENQQDVMKRIENRNYEEFSRKFILGGASDDLGKLDNIMERTKDAEWVLYIFNNIDEVNRLVKIEELIKTQILFLEDEDDGFDSTDSIISLLKEDADRELNKFNLSYLFDDDADGVSLEHLKEKLEEVRQKIKEYKRTPARFWLEDVNHRDSSIELGFE